MRETERLRKTSVLMDQIDLSKLVSDFGVTLEDAKEESESSSFSENQSDNEQT